MNQVHTISGPPQFKVSKRIKNYTRYSESFKTDAVRLVEEQGLTVAQVSRDLGINANSLYNWVNTSRWASSSGLSSDEAAKLERLRKEVKFLREEREIPKKGGGLLRQGIEVRCRFIEAQKANHRIMLLCRVMGVSRASINDDIRN